jgi:hypothetical protein
VILLPGVDQLVHSQIIYQLGGVAADIAHVIFPIGMDQAVDFKPTRLPKSFVADSAHVLLLG